MNCRRKIQHHAESQLCPFFNHVSYEAASSSFWVLSSSGSNQHPMNGTKAIINRRSYKVYFTAVRNKQFSSTIWWTVLRLSHQLPNIQARAKGMPKNKSRWECTSQLRSKNGGAKTANQKIKRNLVRYFCTMEWSIRKCCLRQHFVIVDIMSPSAVNLDYAIHRIPSIISRPVTPIDPAWICESK